jgi:hypothetical protein
MNVLALLVAVALSAVALPGPAAHADAPTLVLAATPAGIAPIGTSVHVTLTATTSDGTPVPGLLVDFARTGPGEGEVGEAADVVTGPDGVAAYDFIGAQGGTAEVTATVTDDAGIAVGSAGPVSVYFYDEPVCRPAPERAGRTGCLIYPKLAGSNEPGFDVLTVTSKQAAGDTVRLFRIGDHRRERIREAKLDAAGRRTFRVTDLNGRSRTTYVAKVLGDRIALTNYVRLR